MDHQNVIRSQIAELESLVQQIKEPEYDAEVVEMALEELEEVKAAGEAVLALNDDLDPYVIESKQPVWRHYEKKYRVTASLMRDLL